MYAFIDTETSGLPNYKLPADDPSQPRLAQFAAILTDGDMQQTGFTNMLVCPDGWEMTAEATAINSLTTERLKAEGVPIERVLDFYAGLIEAGHGIIAYGAQFDCKILRGELRRAGRDDLFAQTRNWCAMRETRGMKIKKTNGKGGQPRLEDVCVHFGIEVEPKPHDARHGARACLAVVRALVAGGTVIKPAVHYAKNHPREAA